MVAKGHTLLVFSAYLFLLGSTQNTTDNLQYVDPLIGSANGGVYRECY